MTEEIRIFLAEDDEDDRDFFQLALKNVKPEAVLVTVSNGAEALKYFSELQPLPHFVFLDINMPLVNGIECLKKLRSVDGLRELPVIMLSTTKNPRMMQESFNSGANFYLQKPNQIGKLAEQLHFCLHDLKSRDYAEPFLIGG